jgi:uncharacterized protein DUF4338
MLLRARAALQKGKRRVTAEELRALLSVSEKRQAIQTLIRRAKSERVGIAMADIIVCGAIPPYSSLLAGKLVAKLAVSPGVAKAYAERYARQESVIAASLDGRPVHPRMELVAIHTNSEVKRMIQRARSTNLDQPILSADSETPNN